MSRGATSDPYEGLGLTARERAALGLPPAPAPRVEAEADEDGESPAAIARRILEGS